jgi:phage/plasmid-associated DNA primase
MKGTAGCGKNLSFSVFLRYVLNPALAIMCPDMEKVFGRFNTMRQGKLLIVLDEAVDGKDRKMNNRIKNYITEDQLQVEEKCKSTVEIRDFSNYAILTNNDFSSIIEQSDRRYLPIIASDHRVKDYEYFDHFANTLLNQNAGKHLFHWLLKRDISKFRPSVLPKTSYKRELAFKQAGSVIKWIVNKFTRTQFKYPENETNHEMVPIEDMVEDTKTCYNCYREWCENNGERNILSQVNFGHELDRLGFKSKPENIVKKSEDGKEEYRTKKRARTFTEAVIKEKLSEFIA